LALATILLFHNADADTRDTVPPKRFGGLILYQNPFIFFNNSIEWTLPDSCHVQILIFNTGGNVVDIFINECQTGGSYEEKWIPDNKVEGIYFCRMVICDDTIYRKLVYRDSETQSDTIEALDKSDSSNSAY